MHRNISSSSYHHEELHILLTSLKAKTKILTTSESTTRKGRQPISNISFQNYTNEHPTTEVSTRGALL